MVNLLWNGESEMKGFSISEERVGPGAAAKG